MGAKYNYNDCIALFRTSSWMWDYKIELHSNAKGLRVFLNGWDESGTKFPIYLGRTKKKTVIRDVCALIVNSDFQIRGPGFRCSYEGDLSFQLFQIELVKSCWGYDDICYGECFLIFSDEELSQFHKLTGSLLDRRLINFVELLFQSESPELLRIELDEEIGKPTSLRFFELATKYIRKSNRRDEEIKGIIETEREIRRLKKNKRDFGPEELCSNIPLLISRFGNKIPGGYLIHAAQFQRPDPGDELLALLMSWKHSKAIPTFHHESKWPKGDGEFLFFDWLLGGRELEVMDWLVKKEGSEAKYLHNQLTKLGQEGKRYLLDPPETFGTNARIYEGLNRRKNVLLANLVGFTLESEQ